MENLQILPLGEHAYAVTVHQGATETNHRVTVPEDLRTDLGEPDEERLVRESFSFLLEREPATSILREFSLRVIGDYFPEYREEIATRLA